MTAPTSIHEAARRQVKVQDLVAVLIEVDATAAVVEKFTDDQWRLATARANERFAETNGYRHDEPSNPTKRRVCRVIAQRERDLAAIEDPFAGLIPGEQS